MDEDFKHTMRVCAVIIGFLLFAWWSISWMTNPVNKCRSAKNGFAYQELNCEKVTGYNFQGERVAK